MVQTPLTAASLEKYVSNAVQNESHTGILLPHTPFRQETSIALFFPQKQEVASKWKEKRSVPYTLSIYDAQLLSCSKPIFLLFVHQLKNPCIPGDLA